jgi:nucleoside-diphosphate-sugar epimerase
MKTALVTGGAGFVGSHLAKQLLEKGVRVIVIDDLSTGKLENLPVGVDFILGDIRKANDVRRALEGCDTVCHLAARVELQKAIVDPADCFSVNVEGTAQIVRGTLAQKGRRLIFASSCAVYPLHPDKPLSEDQAVCGTSPYSLSKRAGEETLVMYAALENLNACSLRCFNIYGPGQRPDSPYAAVIPKFVSRALRGEPITLNGGGKQTRDFIHVDDVVAAYLLAADKNITGVFNIGTGTATSVRTLGTIIQDIEGKSQLVDAPALPGDASSSQADICRAKEALNFQPKRNLKKGLNDLYQLMR